MSSSFFSWLDYSDQDRKQMLEVIDLFAESDIRDELGLGSVRDAFADLFFPGTSTLQTRARYFLFVPWMYLNLERRRVKSLDIAARARAEEVALIRSLKAFDTSESGIIGLRAGAGLQTLPSSIYWSGLSTWGVRAYPYSHRQYHRSLDGFYRSILPPQAEDDLQASSSAIVNWHSGLPSAPQGFPNAVSLQLTRPEAQYLKERVQVNCRGSLLALLVDLPAAGEDVAFPWLHPEVAAFGQRIQEQLHHAQLFSEVMHGASLLYNLLLAQLAHSKKHVTQYEELVEEWAERLTPLTGSLATWELSRFWAIVRSRGARVPPATQRFVEAWVGRALALPHLRKLADDAEACSLISQREWAIKRGQARLYNQRALEKWTGAAGTGQLSYRWRVAQTLVSDIVTGLTAGDTNA